MMTTTTTILRRDREEEELKEDKGRDEKDDKNGFGSQDGQEVPNSRERIVRNMPKLVQRSIERRKDEWTTDGGGEEREWKRKSRSTSRYAS